MKTLSLFIFLIVLTQLSAQNNQEENFNNSEINSVLKQQTLSLITLVMADSIYSDVKFVVNHYDAVLHISDTTFLRAWKKNILNKKTIDSTKIEIFNPFSINDLPFIILQQKDTSIQIRIVSLSKTSIENRNAVSKPVLLIEKPIFSTDFKQAYIRTSVDFKGGCIGYETYYLFENGSWKRIKRSMTYRC